MHEDQQSNRGGAVEPGQIWVIEQISDAAICPLDRDALTSANVVVYDRALAPLVATILPLGGYAEPLSRDPRTAGSAISPRALEFAADGWSVVQLVEAHTGCRKRLEGAVAALRPVDGGGDLPVRVIAKGATANHWQTRDASVRNLSGLVDELAGEDPLTVIFGPLSLRQPARSQAFTANGLAG